MIPFKPLLGATLMAGMLFPTTAHPHQAGDLASAKAATARFHSIVQARSAGYAELPDAAGITCIDNPAGGMGIHYANGGLVGDPALDPSSPEVLVYEPAANGRLHLVALEYVILESTWRAHHPNPADVPRLFGRRFERLPGAGEAQPQNRYGLPAFYELHLWLWKPNPAGMFDDWNPRVSCP
jgi:hypothetical protein